MGLDYPQGRLVPEPGRWLRRSPILAVEIIPQLKPEIHTPFGALKQIDAGLLNVGYAEVGVENSPAVVLLHGWPYDIRSFADVAPLLATAGYRVIVPYLRGFGTTRFLSSETFRNGQPSVAALDIIDLMDALKIEKAIVAGFDWGARSADIMAALWPERCKALVSVSGYLIGSRESGKIPLSPKAELQWWYQYYFATERGQVGYDKYRRDFARLIWQLASPKWNFDETTFDRSATSLDNPDHVRVVIHNYRWRLGLVEGEPKYDNLEMRLAEGPVITVAYHYPGRGCKWCATPGGCFLFKQVLGQICASDYQRGRWSQSASRSPEGFCQSDHRCRQVLISLTKERIP